MKKLNLRIDGDTPCTPLPALSATVLLVVLADGCAGDVRHIQGLKTHLGSVSESSALESYDIFS